jgi:predicted lipid-binding transport protein (Tim44 family)
MLKTLTLGLLISSMAYAADEPPQAGDRAADRAAIRAHIDRIFQAFIKKDSAELRATHARNWLGYLEGSREMIRGIEAYMD